MLQARSTDDHGISIFTLQCAVMGHPAKGNLGVSEVVLLGDRLKEGERLKVMLIPVPFVRFLVNLRVLGYRNTAHLLR